MIAPPFIHPFDDDKLHEECGVFGIFGHHDSAAHTTLGLHALQHRGQGSAGIVTFDGMQYHSHRSLGLVGDNFSSAAVINRLGWGRASSCSLTPPPPLRCRGQQPSRAPRP